MEIKEELASSPWVSLSAEDITMQAMVLEAPGGTGEHFSLNLTRQLVVCEGAEDEDIWQLRLTFEFEPDNELRALSRGYKWCGSLSELPEFREFAH